MILARVLQRAGLMGRPTIALCGFAASAAACALLAGSGCGADGDEASSKKADELSRASEALYSRNCEVCHGAQGRGDGPAAYLLNPKPRDFRRGAYRLVSTDNGIATEDDIVKTLDRGMAGSPMASWPQLSAEEKRGIARHILAFRRDELVQLYLGRGDSREKAEQRAAKKMEPGTVIAGTAPTTEYSRQELVDSFVELCASCHAEDGTGRDDPAWRTAEGFPIESRNFKAGVFKGGRADLDLYQRISAGMPGTPMPGFGTIPPEQIWKMVRYIQSLSDPEAQERAWVRNEHVEVLEIDTVPVKASANLWNSAPATRVGMLPLWAHRDAVTSVTVRAMQDGSRLGILLEWSDPRRDDDASVTNSFDDGAAIMFSHAEQPPPFPMGAPGETNEIWHWRATADKPPEIAATADVYYSDEHGWSDAPGDDVFMTATARNNPKGATAPGGYAREYSAQRFGTLTARPADGETSRTDAEWSHGRWRVAFVRDLATERDSDFELTAADVSIAFAVWDGRLHDRDGKKSVTIWNRLSIKPQEKR